MNHALKAEIERRLKEQKMSIAELERRAGLKINVVRNIFSGRSMNPSAQTMYAIGKTLGCRVEDLLNGNSARPLTAQHKLSKEGFDLFLSATEIVLDVLKKDKLDLNLDDVVLLIKDAYSFGMANDSGKINEKVVRWIIDQRF